MGKIVRQTGLFSLGMATGLGERKLNSNLERDGTLQSYSCLRHATGVASLQPNQVLG